MRLLDAEHDQRLGDVVGQIGLVVQVQLFETLEDVIEAAQATSPGTASGLGCRLNIALRRLKSASPSTLSALPSRRRRPMYSERVLWSSSVAVAALTAAGCPTERTVSDLVICGWALAKNHATMAPQSWPATWALSRPNALMSPATSSTSRSIA